MVPVLRIPLSVKGQALVDYALIIMLVALVAITGLTIFGEGVQSLFLAVLEKFRGSR